MATVVVRSEPNRPLATVVEAGGHVLVADEPIAAGGDDLGPTPYELLLAALGSCTAMTLRLYARRKGWRLERVEIRLSHGRRPAGAADDAPLGERIDRIDREIRLDGPLDAVQRARLLEIAGRCPVHRTLLGRIEIVDEGDPTPAESGSEARG